MPNQERYSVETVIKAIEGSRGIKSQIARKLGCDRGTVDNYITRHPTVARAYQAEREAIVDTAEVQAMVKVNEGDGPMIRFILATLGKDRGYVERQEVDLLDVKNMTDEQLATYIATGIRTIGGGDRRGKAAGAEAPDAGNTDLPGVHPPG